MDKITLSPEMAMRTNSKHFIYGNKPQKLKKGRSSELVAQRNTSLIKRFNKLFEEDRLRIDDVLTKLSKEFFLSETTVFRIITINLRK